MAESRFVKGLAPEDGVVGQIVDDEFDTFFVLGRFPLLQAAVGERHLVLFRVGDGSGGEGGKAEVDDGAVLLVLLGEFRVDGVVGGEDGVGEVECEQDALAGFDVPDTAAGAGGESQESAIIRDGGGDGWSEGADGKDGGLVGNGLVAELMQDDAAVGIFIEQRAVPEVHGPGLGGDDELGCGDVDQPHRVVLDVVTEHVVAAADRLQVCQTEGNSLQSLAVGEAEDAGVSDAAAYADDFIVTEESIGALDVVGESFADLDGGAGAEIEGDLAEGWSYEDGVAIGGEAGWHEVYGGSGHRDPVERDGELGRWGK